MSRSESRDLRSTDRGGRPIAELGEFGLIAHIASYCKPRSADSNLLKGIGDDAALLRLSPDARCLWCTDMLFEGVHFDLSYVPLKHLGYKAMMSTISDIAAMNGSARYALVSLGISNQFSVEDIELLYEGFRFAAEETKISIVGGDTTSSRAGMSLSISIIGEVHPERVVMRSGAQDGDYLCVTGDLGAAYLGLRALQKGQETFLESQQQPDLQPHEYVLERYLKPRARTDLIDLFAQQHLTPTAMIDISDGLCSDLLHLCTSSQVGVSIEEACLPISSKSLSTAQALDVNPYEAAYHGGEDYELLFTLSESSYALLSDYAEITRIGRISSQKLGCFVHQSNGKKHPIEAKGWEHFRETDN